jgi:hypothetical protein
MRNKKAKALSRIAHREAPLENELISNIMKKYKVPDEKDTINRIAYRYNRLSPRATYQRIKKLYKATPRNQRAGLLEKR